MRQKFDTGVKIIKSRNIRAVTGEVCLALHRHTPLLESRVKLRLFLQKIRGYDAVADPWQPIYIDPTSIRSYRPATGWGENRQSFHRDKDIGRIVGGNWDQDEATIPINMNEKFAAVIEHFENGTDWSETGIIDHMAELISKRGVADGCKSIEEVHSRYDYIDSLYQKIKENGYKSQAELGTKSQRHPTFEEVCISIGRDGGLIFGGGGGTHRLAIARHLGVDKIPVGVIVRHRQWQEFREKAHEGKLSDKSHPDLCDL